MADKSNIEWTDATWNPIVGCSIKSPGCANCYAMPMAKRIEAMGGAPQYRGLTKTVKGKAVFTGKVARAPDHILTQPLRWKRGRRIFVNSMGDLFHENVPDEWIDKVFAVMALAPQHTMQVLTKRSARMRAYMNDPHTPYRVAKAMDGVLVDLDHDPVERWAAIPGYAGYEASTHGAIRSSSGPLATGINPLHEREQVTLWNGGASRTWFVHALVLMAHRGLPPEGHEARHRNGDRNDNRLANLLWGTRSENQADKVRHGSIGGPQKLTLEQVSSIREARAAGGVTQHDIADQYGISRSLVSMIESGSVWPYPISWPLKSVWLGVSTERQQEADERIPDLLATPAAVRFISAEPLLGPLDIARYLHDSDCRLFNESVCTCSAPREVSLDWVILGGESGPGARPMHPDWARSLRDQCAAAGVPFFFKQWGEWVPQVGGVDGWTIDDNPEISRFDHRDWDGDRYGDPYRPMWCDDRDDDTVSRVGKKRAGRLLDGVEHNGMPEAR